MGHRDPVISRDRDGGRDPRDDLIGDAGVDQQLQLFTAPSEQEGISPLEPDDSPAFLRFIKQKLVDLFLGHGVIPCPLADADVFRFPWEERKQRVSDQGVIDDDICFFDYIHCFDGEQTRISGACPHKPHFSCFHSYRPFILLASSIPSFSGSQGSPVIFSLCHLPVGSS